jgi:hypothetical protein
MFDPAPAEPDVSALWSRCRHSRRWLFRRCGHCESISLRPFAPRTLLRFVATMNALTPVRRFLTSPRECKASVGSGQVSLCHVSGLLTIPSPVTHRSPRSLLHATPQLRGLPTRVGLGFVIGLQTRRPARPNRVYLRYGLVVHLLLLPTSSLEDAVTFGYRPESVYLKRTYTSLAKHTYRRTNRRRKAGGS